MHTDPITSFTGTHRWLSNFWPSPISWAGRTWPTVEHAHQAAKATAPADADLVAGQATPGRAKRTGSRITIRADWDDVRVDVMTALTNAKYDQNPTLAGRLVATGTVPLVEGKRWGDTFWGTCDGEGHNHLGRILMATRARLNS